MQKSKIQKLLILSIFGCLSGVIIGSSRASAATLSVPSQYGTISSAVSSAKNGDEIIVSDGVYREQLDLSGKYIILRSLNGPNSTVLAPNPGKTGIMIQSVPFAGGVPRTTVSGFRITGGYSPDGQGGAITIANNADPVIQNNIIDNNQSLVHGGGILVYNNSNPTIKNNTIQNNFAKTFGGGIFVVKSSSPNIYGNTISNNSVSGAVITNGGSAGGGIYIENVPGNGSVFSYPTIVNNIISDNDAEFAGGGIMLRTGASPVIEGNTINGNSAPYGGGIHAETEGSSLTIAGNTIIGNNSPYNSSFAGSGHGGGISVYASSKPFIKNNQILSNTSGYGGGGIVLAESSNSTIESNHIINNGVSNTGGNTEGGGIYIANATARVVNNLIRSNTGWNGGGIGVLGNSTIDIISNTIVKNNDTHAGIGGGIFVENANVAVEISNNILALNEDYQIYEGGNNKATLKNNLFTNSGSGMYKSAFSSALNSAVAINSSSSVNATSTVDTDPLFTDSNAENYQIQSGSGAQDSGFSTTVTNEDIDRKSRPFGAGFDIGAFEYTTSTDIKIPVYRFWSDEQKGHFYTKESTEKNLLISDFPSKTWKYEYIAYDAYATSVTDTVPIYRIWNNTFKAHAYLQDVNEKNTAVSNGWTDEGVAYYGFDLSYSGVANTVYRFWSPTFQNHFFTSSTAEKDGIIATHPSSIWTYESGRFKVPK